MSERQWQVFYGTVKGTARSTFLEGDRWKLDPAYRIVAQVCTDCHSVIDLCCGWGIQYAAFREYAPHVRYTGVDFSKSALASARTSFAGVTFERADAFSLPYPQDTFEAAILRHVLEHYEPGRIVPLLAEAARVASRLVAVLFFLPPGQSRRKLSPQGIPVLTYDQAWMENAFRAGIGKHKLSRMFVRRPPGSPAYTDQELWVARKHVAA